MSYEASKNYLGDVEPLVKALYDLKQQGSLLDSQKAAFLKVLQDKGDLFDEYYKGQFNLFVKVCGFYVSEFDTEEQNNLFMTLPTGDTFTKEKAQYFQMIEKSVKDFKSTLGKIKLKNLWKVRTGTESPEDWSRSNLTPIICMVDAQDYDAARQAFLTLSRVRPEDSETEKAMNFLESATFYEALRDSKKIDDAFNRKILKEYAVLLKADEVREYLKERATAQPHEWYSNPMVDKLIREYASARYDTEGSVIATNIVDAMDDINTLKEYLKKLIQDDISVGLSIIKNADRK